MRLLTPVAALLIVGGTVAAAAFLEWPRATAFLPSSIELAISVLVAMAAVATLALSLGGSVRGRLHVAVVLLAVAEGLLVAHLFDRWPFAADPFANPRYVAFLTLVLAATIYGLVRRRIWARWVGLAFGTFGTLSSGINAVQFVGAQVRDPWTWTFCAFSLGSAIVGLNLADRRVADAFLQGSGPSALWRSTDPLVRVTRWAVVSCVAAVSMLLVYAWLQPFVAGTADRALALALVLGAGAVLTMLRKTLGGLVLGIGGAALAAFLVSIARAGAAEPGLVAYYAVFWAPGALLGMLCGAMMLGRALRR